MLILTSGKAEISCDAGISKVRQRSLAAKATRDSTRKFVELVLLCLGIGHQQQASIILSTLCSLSLPGALIS